MRKESVIGITGNETIIGSGVRVRGNLTSEHDIIIDGNLVGNVKTKGAINVGVNANIKGNLVARDISVSGQVEGDLKVASQATIHATGRVQGNIASGNLAIDSGGVFVGSSVMTMTDHSPEPQELSNDAPTEDS